MMRKTNNNNNRTIVRSRTFNCQAPPPSSSTATYHPPPPHASKKNHQATSITGLVGFPTCPQRTIGNDLLHFSHPQHPLAHIHRMDLFTCFGCKEHGAGKRFACQHCDYQLHEFCALAPQALKSHPLHVQHQLFFYSKPVKGGMAKSKCDACGNSIRGYAFRCIPCSFQLHPCCAMLPQEIIFPSHPHTLTLLPVPSSSSSSSSSSSTAGVDSSLPCGECKKRRPGRLYRCMSCDYCLHAACAKVVFNGLLDSGIKDPDDEKHSSRLGAAAHIASKVVSAFVGGIVEGVGEGVGDLIVQNIITAAGGPLIAPRKIDYH
ncbi:hypothetical protein SAY87_021507 [Trapa incisa]|uniref:DC1 domain-containing protein n=2 Tax=Trapa TaxID=22665 RepID=A0AAN7N1Z5_TRANT|nr:hypothetical protein SAY87_021507 [Trapa incisa]KAK4803766.1 hypothetical protein SAY86_003583 [Trapa natans]